MRLLPTLLAARRRCALGAARYRIFPVSTKPRRRHAIFRAATSYHDRREEAKGHVKNFPASGYDEDADLTTPLPR
jgi:hypothetical protein